MRFNQIIQSLRTNLDENVMHDVELDEVRMGQKDLTRFAAGEIASKMIAGFEAELCFRGIGGGSGDFDYENGEPDYDSDESCVSIDDAERFFYDGDHNSRRDVARLRSQMEEDFLQWQSEKMHENWTEVQDEVVRVHIEVNDWDWDAKIEEYLADEMGLDESKIADVLHAGKIADEMTSSKQQSLFRSQDEDYSMYMEAVDSVKQSLEDYVTDSISNSDRNYEAAQEEWMDEQRENNDDQYSERAWLESENLDAMSSVQMKYDVVMWPHWSYPPQSEGGYNSESAGDLAYKLRQALDVEVKAGGGYHSTTRKPGLWIIEEDGSLNADDDGDMPCEIVSPPMPLPECIEKMREFFEWAKSEDAYSNDSTGLHVGISMPGVQDEEGNRLDYLKLALFLGDQKVLDDFGRDGNHYCESSLGKIAAQVRHVSDEKLSDSLNDMRDGLIQMARKTLGQSAGHGKYSSINLKDGYVEFRSMGGENYIDNIGTVIETVQRFAYAYSIASDSNAERQEYGKKLYKLLHKSIKSQDIINNVFVEYRGGEGFRVDMLKQALKKIQLQRNIERDEKDDDIKVGDWEPDDAEWDSTLSRSSAAYWEQMLHRVVQPNRAKYWYDVKRNNSAMKIEVVATNPSEAIVRAKIDVSEWRTADNSEFETEATSRYTEAGTAPPASEPDTQTEWELYNHQTGQVARRFEATHRAAANRQFYTIIDALINSGQISREDRRNWAVRPVEQGGDNQSTANDIQALRDRAAQLQQNRQGGSGEPIPGSTADIQRQRAAAADSRPQFELYNRITGHVAQRYSAADHGEAWEFGRTVLGTLINSGQVARDDQSQWSVRVADQ